MRTCLVESDIAAIAVLLACCWLVLQRFTSDRWKRRFGAIGSPLIAPPAYRVLFLLVVIGVLLISVLPEAAFVLPALDAVGLDIVTIFAALELRHYLASVARVVGTPTSVAGCSTHFLRRSSVRMRGHLIESAVGAQLVNAAAAGECEVFHWRERNVEVDFIVRCGHALTAWRSRAGGLLPPGLGYGCSVKRSSRNANSSWGPTE
jgi:hypothetical protein